MDLPEVGKSACGKAVSTSTHLPKHRKSERNKIANLDE